MGLTIVGSVLATGFTILKAYSIKKDSHVSSNRIDAMQKQLEDCDARSEDLKERVAVQESEIEHIKLDNERLHDNLGKLHDLLLNLLTDK